MDYQEEKTMLNEAITRAREIAKKNYLQGMLCHANPDDEELDGYIECGREHEQIAKWLEELMQYKQIGTLEEVRDAVEKQRAKKALLGGNTDKLTGDIRICPCCCGIVGMDDMRADYCADCGQAINWSEEMYDNQKEIDKINEEIKSIHPKLELSSFGMDGNTIISVGLMLPVKGNSEVIKKLENVGFKKLYRQKSSEPFNSEYSSGRYKGYSMYQKMSMDLRGENNER